jgi:selenocysteine-specific elongation factor
VELRNITLGTAGHIDHGKTALVRLLTGCETDRLKEEKERGMSIELGFAPCLVSGTQIGIVDVPGHENFIKTMVAGATSIDGVILVIAADDGIMPQTREHLDILTLLGVRHGMIALTKVDIVTTDRVGTITEAIRKFLLGTFLEGAPILPLSNITGAGFESFYDALKNLVGSISPRTADRVFRLPIERAFSAKGYGTIVAGIPACGSVGIGDEVVLLPQDQKGRVRAIQVFNHESDRAMVGQCAALNIPQWDHQDIKRGNVMTIAGYFGPEQWYLCELTLLTQEKNQLKNGSEVKFHTGTSEVIASAYLFQETPLQAGQRCLIQVRLDTPIVAGPGDHFIIRVPSPARTVGGGIIVEAIPGRLRRHRPEVLAEIQQRAEAVKSPTTFIEYCVKSAESLAADIAEVSIRTKIPQPQVASALSELAGQGRLIAMGRLYVHVETAQTTQKKLLERVADVHCRQPESPGIRREQLLVESAIRKEIFDGLVERMLAGGTLVDRKGYLALPQHREQFNDAEQKLLQSVESMFKSHPFDPPSPQAVAEQLRGEGVSPLYPRHGRDGQATQEQDALATSLRHKGETPWPQRDTAAQVARAIRILIEQQRLVRVDQDLYFHAEAIADARARLVRYIQETGQLESVKFKYVLDTTRKYAIPLLDYFDKIGVTRRAGYTRYLK